MIDMNDVQQILDDPNAAAWELRDVAKDLLNELEAQIKMLAAERERCAAKVDEIMGHQTTLADAIRSLGE